jgi:hypothetical protein
LSGSSSEAAPGGQNNRFLSCTQVIPLGYRPISNRNRLPSVCNVLHIFADYRS